jgi:hypothetical protein
MLGNSNPTLAGDRLKETAISPARPVVEDCGHRDYGCDSRGPWSRRHGCGYRGAALALSTVHLECSAEPRLVGAGGTLANLIFGALFWVVARVVRQSASGRYFFWLLMTFNLFEAGGYFLFSGIGDIGDWAAIVARWQPAWAWRVALIAPGTATYFFLWVPLCAWNTCASDQKFQRSSTEPERTNCPCGPNRGQKRTAIATNLQIHERLFNILRELSIGSSSGRIDDHRTADDFN